MPGQRMPTSAGMEDNMRDAVLRSILEELIIAAISSMPVQHEGSSVCRSAVNKSFISALKDGVDHLCEREFGLESLEADGPADSWLLHADLSSSGATHAAGERVFCKGPSWDRFVQKMQGQQDTTVAADIEAQDTVAPAEQHVLPAAGLPSVVQRNSSSFSHTQGPVDIRSSNSFTLRWQPSQQQSSRTPSRTASGKLPSPSAATVIDFTHSAGTQVAVAELVGSPLPPSGRISSSNSLQRAGSKTASLSNSSKSLVSAVEAGLMSPVDTEPAAAVHTAVRSLSSKSGSATQDVENAAWMASLRKGGVSSGSSSRRVSRSHSAAGASPQTPARTISNLTHSESARESALGHALASPATPPTASSGASSSSSKHLTVSTKGRETPVSASRSNSSKYSLRRSRPGTPTAGSIECRLGSHPTSPVGSPRMSAAGGRNLVTTGRVSGGNSSRKSSRSSITAAVAPATSVGVGNQAAGSNVSHSSSNSPKSKKPRQLTSVPKASDPAPAAKAAAEAAATAAEELRRAARYTSGDVPLPVTAQQEDLWATDTTAVQLFMDEYKEVIDAVDTAYEGSPPGAGRHSVTQHDAQAAATGDAVPICGQTVASVAGTEAMQQKIGVGTHQQLAVAGYYTALNTALPEQASGEASGPVSKVGGDAVVAAVATRPTDAVVQAVKAAEMSLMAGGKAKKDVGAAVDLQQQVVEEEPAVTPACGCHCTVM